jgi:hypothetical protein
MSTTARAATRAPPRDAAHLGIDSKRSRRALTGQDEIGFLLRLVDLDVVSGPVEQMQLAFALIAAKGLAVRHLDITLTATAKPW